MKAKIKRLLGISLLWAGGYLLPIIVLNYLIGMAFKAHYPELAAPVMCYISAINDLAFGSIFYYPFKWFVLDRFFPDPEMLERKKVLDCAMRLFYEKNI